jgi:hypothetical protein
MFEGWRDSAEYPTLFRADRDVFVDVSRVFPSGGGRRKDELPLWVKAGALRLEPWMLARQIAWIRRCDGGWLAVVLMPAGSANGQSGVTMQLWLEPDAITTDLTVGS